MRLDQQDPHLVRYEETQPPPGTGRAWAWGGLAFVAGLAVGAAIFSYRPLPVTEATTTTMLAPPPAAAAIPSEASSSSGAGVSQRVPGFDATLLVALRTPRGGAELVIWPSRGAPYRRLLPVGIETLRFDAGGEWLGALVPVPGEAGGTLYAGTVSQSFPAAGRVTGFAWHSADSGRLALIRVGQDGAALEAGTASATGKRVASGLDPWERLVSWGEWGFGLTSGRDSRIIDRDGAELWSGRGGMLAAAADGALLLERRSATVIVAPGGEVRSLQGPAPEVAVFSPVARVLARVIPDGDEGPRLVISDQEGEVMLDIASTPDSILAWSPDGRFILASDPARRDVSVVEVASGNVTALELDRPVLGVAARAVAG